MTSSCSIPTRSGLVLAGLLDEAPDVETYPLVLLLHGFTGWKEEEHLVSLAGSLRVAGIASLRFDAPGSGDSEGTFADDYRLSSYLASVQDVLDWACANTSVDERRIAIWGHSMGGFVAIASAVCYAHRFQAVCGSQSSAGKMQIPSDQQQQWQRTGSASFAHDRFPNLDLPYAFYLDREQHDLFESIGDLQVPLLLIGGSRDVDVPAETVKAIHDAAPEPKTYREFNVDHFYKKSKRSMEAINAITVEFFSKYLSAP